MDPAPQPASRTCAKHGVVLDPRGHCVICRREKVEVDGDPSGARLAGFALAALAALAVGALVFRGAARRPELPVVAVDAGAAPPPALAPPLDDLDVIQAEARAAALNREAADRKAAIEKAMRRVPIRIYTTRWCELCRTATGFFGQKGYVWEEIDVEADREGLAALRKINPAATVPTIVIGEEVIVGYGPTAVLGAVYRAADKKVR